MLRVDLAQPLRDSRSWEQFQVKHSSLTSRYAPIRAMGSAFRTRTVARAYQHRPPYPEEAIARLLSLIGAGPRCVLDAGCGPGKLARAVAPRVERVDAVDPSNEMLAAGRSLPGGDDPRIRWVHARVEDAVLAGPYGLIVAGASVHWFDLDLALPRLSEQLEAGGKLAMLDGDGAYRAAWQTDELFMELGERRTGTRPHIHTPSDEPSRILDHPLFRHDATLWLEPFEFEQTVDDYIECQYSRASLSRETLGPELSERLAGELRALLEPHATAGRVRYEVRFRLEWGSLG